MAQLLLPCDGPSEGPPHDNWDTMALACRPPLTTIDMALTEVGRTAALRLLDAINDGPAPGVHTVACRLVVREST